MITYHKNVALYRSGNGYWLFGTITLTGDKKVEALVGSKRYFGLVNARQHIDDLLRFAGGVTIGGRVLVNATRHSTEDAWKNAAPFEVVAYTEGVQ